MHWLNGTCFSKVDLTLRVRQSAKRGSYIRHAKSDGYFRCKGSAMGPLAIDPAGVIVFIEGLNTTYFR